MHPSEEHRSFVWRMFWLTSVFFFREIFRHLAKVAEIAERYEDMYVFTSTCVSYVWFRARLMKDLVAWTHVNTVDLEVRP